MILRKYLEPYFWDTYGQQGVLAHVKSIDGIDSRQVATLDD